MSAPQDPAASPSPEPPRSKILARLLTWNGATAVATIASVAILATQTLDLRRSVQRDTYQKAYETVYDLDRHFLDHPELKAYFYGGKVVDGSTDALTRAKVESTAEWISDFFDNIYYNVKSGPDEDWTAWESYIQETFRRSPALRDYLRQHRDWYSPELGASLDALDLK
jgi:hypothetical protein